MNRQFTIGCLLLLTALARGDLFALQSQRPIAAPATTDLRPVVLAAFQATHDGWSADELILRTGLNDAFITECQNALPDVDAVTFNWTLLNMRKAGQLKIPTTRSNRESVSEFTPVAEIAARLVQDRRQVSTDRMMADPELRAEFDREVREIDPTLDLYRVRKAAFLLRKQRRLKPELISRIADWGREITTLPLEQLRHDRNRLPEQPGIYIFRDATGYLYIGQSENLRKRLDEHLAESSNFSLAQYLAARNHDQITLEIHAFAADSRAKETMIRRAYESELIASRKPKFNIQP